MIYFEYHQRVVYDENYEVSYDKGIITNVNTNCSWNIITEDGIWMETINSKDDENYIIDDENYKIPEQHSIMIDKIFIDLNKFNQSSLYEVEYHTDIFGQQYETKKYDFDDKVLHFLTNLFRQKKLERVLNGSK